MLMPRKVKHRKQQRGRRGGNAKGGVELNFGDFGIQASNGLDHRSSDRSGPYRDDPSREAWWQGLDPRVPRQPVTQKPAETRMVPARATPSSGSPS